jgi:hypothetical protein
MAQLNRREFLRKSVAVSTATALAPHIWAASSEGERRAPNYAVQDARTVQSVQPRFGGDWNFVHWRQGGLSVGEAVVHYGQYPR